RHTRSYGDWSSDVCSSDLSPLGKMMRDVEAMDPPPRVVLEEAARREEKKRRKQEETQARLREAQERMRRERLKRESAKAARAAEIGRASCRERVEGAGGGG